MNCLKLHTNGFEHFNHQIPELEQYDLGIKMKDDSAPPPPGSPFEPRLYLYVSVRKLNGEKLNAEKGVVETINYARSRSDLSDGFPSSEADQAKLQSDVLAQLREDIKAHLTGNLNTSMEQPKFI